MSGKLLWKIAHHSGERSSGRLSACCCHMLATEEATVLDERSARKVLFEGQSKDRNL